jgi:nitrogen fixation NifU-like protein
MSDLSDLYQQVIMDHNKKPQNFLRLEGANRTAQGHNPLCGDQLTVYLEMEGDVIKNLSFLGSGCAISKASASLMTGHIKGKTRAEANRLFDQVHAMLLGDLDLTADLHDLGKLAALSGVSKFPARVKCASLAWHTLRAALNQSEAPVSTE